MKENAEVLRIVVAETSAIVRYGVVTLLKRLANLNVKPVEATSPEGLENCLHTDTPDILLVNPTFGGWFNVDEFRADAVHSAVKCIALNCSITDPTLLQGYDESITLYETAESLEQKLQRMIHDPEEENEETEGEGILSQREQEVVVCVVKGMTNKEIADKLYLSIHTVITHRRNIARKLEIHSVAGLTIYAIANKLVELSEVKL